MTSSDRIFRFINTIPREYLPHFEYKFFDDRLLRRKVQSDLHIIQSQGGIVKYEDLGSGKYMFAMKKSQYDSEIFGMNMWQLSHCFINARSDNGYSRTATLMTKEILNVIFQMKINYLSFSISSNVPQCKEIFNSFIAQGGYYINTILTFCCLGEKLAKYRRRKAEKEIIIREAMPSDESELKKISKNSFKIDRFHGDPNLSREKSDLIYELAICNAVKGVYADVLLVAECDGKIAGYYSARFEKLDGIKKGSAISAAVGSEFRNRGVFRALHESLMIWFYKNVDFCEMGTYLNNIPVHKVWTDDTLTIVRCQHYLGAYL